MMISLMNNLVGVYTKNELAGQDEFHPLSFPPPSGNPVFLVIARRLSGAVAIFNKYCHSGSKARRMPGEVSHLLSSLMGFFPVNPLICRAEWTYAVFDVLDKPKGKSLLLLSCARAYITFDAALCHFLIFFGYGSCIHLHPPELN
jgi:hypothetical protein